MMAFVNEVYEVGTLTNDELTVLIKLLNPFAPHLTEEMWEYMGNKTLLSLEKWPQYDESKTVDDTIKIAVQVNGKLKATIDISKNISKDDALATAKNEPKVAEFIAGKEIVKEIFVPGKIVNIVIK